MNAMQKLCEILNITLFMFNCRRTKCIMNVHHFDSNFNCLDFSGDCWGIELTKNQVYDIEELLLKNAPNTSLQWFYKYKYKAYEGATVHPYTIEVEIEADSITDSDKLLIGEGNTRTEAIADLLVDYYSELTDETMAGIKKVLIG